MNDFTPKQIHQAALYLQEKLENTVKKSESAVYVEEKKSSFIKQLVTSLFK